MALAMNKMVGAVALQTLLSLRRPLLALSDCHARRQWARQAYSMEHAKQDLRSAMQYTQHVNEAPTPVLVVGSAGLLPFISFPFMCLSGSFDPAWAFNQLAYGACVLSFMGGVRWAGELALGKGGNLDAHYTSLTLAVANPVVAWLSLMMPVTMGYLSMSAALVGAAYMDIFISEYPRWYKGLRGALTAVAVGSLLITLFFRMILKERQHKKELPEPHH